MKAFSYLRFSTTEQAKGDSLRRQLENTRKYAKEHGFDLDETLKPDRGVSAFKGKNSTAGSLKVFLDMVKAGKILKGSALIVESYDRLTRQQYGVATQLVRSLADNGIEVHSLSERHVLRPEYSFRDTIVLDVALERSHEESQRKSERVGAAWRNKKAKAQAGIAITSRLPFWLSAAGKGEKIQIIPDRAEVIREIFNLSEQGLGKTRIAALLNTKKVPVFGRGKAWHPSYVQKILSNQAVIGTYTPNENINGVKTPIAPIEGFFPPVISLDQWSRTRAALAERNVSGGKGGGGGGGEFVNNLFSHLTFDKTLGVSMHFERFGRKRGEKTFLISDSQRFDKRPHRVPYPQFEEAFLRWIDQIDWHSILGETEDDEIKKAEAALSEVREAWHKNERLLARFQTLLTGDAEPPSMLLDQIKQAELSKKEIEKQIKAAETTLTNLRREKQTLEDSQSLREAIQASKGSYETRLKLKAEIHRRVSRIDFTFDTDRVVGELLKLHGFTACHAMVQFSNGSKRLMIIGKEHQWGLVPKFPVKKPTRRNNHIPASS